MNEDTRPLMVTIQCITYNHEPYIRQCLEGFVMQKTNFRFEAIVHDDASTDGTAAVIKEYADKYPDIIKPIYETENQYTKYGGFGGLQKIMNEHTHGKYVAFCEGDDYWTDSYKLQKQVNILETNPDCTLCGTGFEIHDENLKQPLDMTIYKDAPIRYTIADWRGRWFMKTLTLMCRADAYFNYVTESNKYQWAKDTYLHYHLLRQGHGMYLCENMGVYHRHCGGVWGGINRASRAKQDYLCLKEIYEKNDAEFYAKRAYIHALFDVISWPELEIPRKKLIIECIRYKKGFKDHIRFVKALIFYWLRKLKIYKT